MTIRACLCSLSLISLHFAAFTQSSPIGNGTTDPELSRPSIMLSGRVIMEDGTGPPSQVAVQTLCRGEKRTVAYTDPQGKFNFTLIEQRSAGPSATHIPDASISGGRDGLPIGDSASPLSNMREWRKCALQADLVGFKSETVDIISRTDNWGGNIGSIRLTRIAQVQ